MVTVPFLWPKNDDLMAGWAAIVCGKDIAPLHVLGTDCIRKLAFWSVRFI